MLANKPLASVPLASSVSKAYTLTAETGVYSLLGQNAELVALSVAWIPKGGVGKPKKLKRKNYESDLPKIEKTVESAVNKALGIYEPEVEAQQPEIVKQVEKDYTAELNELMLKAQADALGLSIQQYLIEAELDDEEAILLFL